MIQFQFGDYSLTYDGDFFLSDKRVIIPPKELAVLKLFLKFPGKLLLKDEIMDHVWPGQDISEESLTRCIYSLRQVLGDNKGYIMTSYGRGYRFIEPVISKGYFSTVRKLVRYRMCVA